MLAGVPNLGRHGHIFAYIYVVCHNVLAFFQAAGGVTRFVDQYIHNVLAAAS